MFDKDYLVNPACLETVYNQLLGIKLRKFSLWLNMQHINQQCHKKLLLVIPKGLSILVGHDANRAGARFISFLAAGQGKYSNNHHRCIKTRF
jgi:hypothetical protein